MENVFFDEYTPKVLSQLSKGAFLTVKSKDKVNTMTIGWGTIGMLWKRPIFTVYVRTSRYTYELLKDAQDFTVSIPLEGQLKRELGYVGKFSGRDRDKIAEMGLTLLPSEKIESPAIAGCNVVYECRILARQPLEPSHFDDRTLLEDIYADGDMHTIFYGEILHYTQK